MTRDSVFRIILLLCLLGTIQGQASGPSGKIKHVIALMLENRSFDHILGLLKAHDPSIEGCLPDMPGQTCKNPLDPSNPDSTSWYPVTDEAVQNCTGGPAQSFVPTRYEVYAPFQNSQNLSSVSPTMRGFVSQYSMKQQIMDCFPPWKVPALTSLASEFAVLNRYYSR